MYAKFWDRIFKVEKEISLLIFFFFLKETTQKGWDHFIANKKMGSSGYFG